MIYTITISDKMVIQLVKAIIDFKNIKLAVVKFSATWCSPCKSISPLYSDLSDKFSHVTFFDVDIDDVEELTKKYNVKNLPTFIFLKNGDEVNRICGANPKKLTDSVESFSKN